MEKRILDLGCGRNKKKNAIGFDCADLEGVDVVGDLMDPLPFKDNEFDVVYLDNVLEHFVEIDPILKEVYRITKSTGRIIFLGCFFNNFFASPIKESSTNDFPTSISSAFKKVNATPPPRRTLSTKGKRWFNKGILSFNFVAPNKKTIGFGWLNETSFNSFSIKKPYVFCLNNLASANTDESLRCTVPNASLI